ncbi:MAG: 2-C-methyl-D-erythritol 2,4-cyclodiphosphate synthase [Planctomycetota bacterium]
MTGYRVGIGFDSHPLVAGRPCVLGGIVIPHPTGPLGHSDGDAVLHAVADALLGAAGQDDLGTLFPDSDPRWKGADSASILGEVMARVRKAGCVVVNVDIVVATDGPRIAPHRGEMRARIAKILGVVASAVNVKGKSLEGISNSSGAVSVQAVCLLSRRASAPNATS